MAAYYNEIDPYAAAWLRNLISAGHIAPGDVDERDIRDVRPDDLKPYTQCHFFAGIGVWSYALRRAGWPDDRPVWTGSCPCQPFSQAGAGAGFDDERHLWPDFHWLIRERQPPVVFGEQVASKDADPWIDLVQADLEVLGYAFGAVPFPAAGVGAPNIRDRLYWMAHADGKRPLSRAQSRVHRSQESPGAWHGQSKRSGAAGRLAGANSHRRASASSPGVLDEEHHAKSRGTVLEGGSSAGAVNGFWRNADWLGCRDGKFRPVEPGTQPLADGAPARVGRLRAYGNAINAEAAIAFINSAMPSLP
jgi:DNA (cytosine-5)-methyltransferase 1